jgi:2-polyprenyl-3-methyl-5-hydroxy-6-metoxy-1,4-benzoquinol methylase
MSESLSSSAPCLLCGVHAKRVAQRLRTEKLVEAYRSELGLGLDLRTDELMYLICDACGLHFFWPAITGDEKFYGDLQKISWYYSAGKPEFHIAAAYVHSAHDVLEIGAGRGLFSREIKPASYTGLEFSPTAIELAAANGVRLLPETVERHAEQNAGRYDIVCTFQVLEHVANPRTFLDAAVTCLKPGGRLIVSVPAEDSFARFAFWDVLNMPPHHVTRWTDSALRSIARICGLRLVELKPEPFGRSTRGPYARSMANQWIAQRLGMEPKLLDERLKAPLFRVLARPAAAVLRGYLSLSSSSSSSNSSLGSTSRRRGQAVLAIFEKELA